MRAAAFGLTILGLAALAACSQPAPANQTALPATASKPPAAGAWRPMAGMIDPGAEYGPEGAPAITVSCDKIRKVLVFGLPQSGEGSGAETATLWADKTALKGPMVFRSAEDAAGDDPPVSLEIKATPQALAAIEGAGSLAIERGDGGHERIDGGAPNAVLKATLGVCG